MHAQHGQAPPAGWYPDPDPAGPGGERWWDGSAWSASTRAVTPYGVPTATAVTPVVDARTGTTSDERTWALMGHLGGVVGIAILAPLVVYLVKRDESPFVRAHAAKALNFHLSWMLWLFAGTAVGLVFTLVTFGLGAIVLVPLLFAYAIALFVLALLATIKAGRGEPAERVGYPLTIPFVS